MTDIDSLFKVSFLDRPSRAILPGDGADIACANRNPRCQANPVAYPTRNASSRPRTTRVCPPFLPLGSPPPNTLPVAAYKSAKHDTTDTRSARVDDEEDPSDSLDVNSSALPADFFDTDNPEDDEDGGRFFGGGVSEKQREILDYVDEQDKGEAPVEVVDTAH